ncbi:MAG TPA: cytochrome c [Candidatus Angelobacter sp.]|jgi:hypothetical protein|nr:cytochrome c [Candidatus Angelobacter sp.]
MRRWAFAAICVCISVTVALLVYAHPLYTTKITWSREVSRLVYRQCASCHHQGGSAFSLMTYQEARPWAESIKQQVLARRMPPWNAVKGFGDFKNDHGLTQEDIQLIAEWVEGGAPQGSPLYLPPKPSFSAVKAENGSGESRLTLAGTTILKHPVQAVGIEPGQIPPAGLLQVVAQRPDGSTEPLIWVEKFNPQFNTTYYFRDALTFPAGTRVEIVPQSGSVTLVVKTLQQSNQHLSRVRVKTP